MTFVTLLLWLQVIDDICERVVNPLCLWLQVSDDVCKRVVAEQPSVPGDSV